MMQEAQTYLSLLQVHLNHVVDVVAQCAQQRRYKAASAGARKHVKLVSHFSLAKKRLLHALQEG